jgi:hypothetical protein
MRLLGVVHVVIGDRDPSPFSGSMSTSPAARRVEGVQQETAIAPSGTGRRQVPGQALVPAPDLGLSAASARAQACARHDLADRLTAHAAGGDHPIVAAG